MGHLSALETSFRLVLPLLSQMVNSESLMIASENHIQSRFDAEGIRMDGIMLEG